MRVVSIITMPTDIGLAKSTRVINKHIVSEQTLTEMLRQFPGFQVESPTTEGLPIIPRKARG